MFFARRAIVSVRAVLPSCRRFVTTSSAPVRRSFADGDGDGAVPGVPGLFYYPNFLSPVVHARLLDASIALDARLEALATGRTSSARATATVPPSRPITIPQPDDLVRSAKHNLQSVEYYQALRVPDLSGGNNALQCEHFRRYGEDGHALTYFRGTHNLPSFARRDILDAILARVPTVAQLAAEVQHELIWKMTFNVYRYAATAATTATASSPEVHLAGFPFHQDLPANGTVTMILSLQRGAELQIVHKDHLSSSADGTVPVGHEGQIHILTMEAGSLLLLSGEARWDWRHRVLPSAEPSSRPGEIGRISIVFGCQ